MQRERRTTDCMLVREGSNRPAKCCSAAITAGGTGSGGGTWPGPSAGRDGGSTCYAIQYCLLHVLGDPDETTGVDAK